MIFTLVEREINASLARTLRKWNAINVLRIAHVGEVPEGDLSSILFMVPDSDNLRAEFHLDFVSDYVAEQITCKIKDSGETSSFSSW